MDTYEILDPNDGVPDGDIIGGHFTYRGDRHPWARGLRVRVVAVHRGEELLRSDEEVGELQPDDVVEFTPWMEEAARFSWVSSDAYPLELVPLEAPGSGSSSCTSKSPWSASPASPRRTASPTS